jgi:UDP-sulfoquinovose synthase
VNILVLGGDGYLGWPTALYLSRKGHRVGIVDNFARRGYDLEMGVDGGMSCRAMTSTSSWATSPTPRS